jgi:hypothetical protein
MPSTNVHEIVVPIDIDCVDGTGTDPESQVDRRLYPRALRVHSLGHMVDSILGYLLAAGSPRIRRLRVFAHGAPGRQGLGQSAGGPDATAHYREISIEYLRYVDILARLRGHFERGGWVELHGCRVGAGIAGHELVRTLSAVWQVRVAAGMGDQTIDPGFEGKYIVGLPNGTVQVKFGRG